MRLRIIINMHKTSINSMFPFDIILKTAFLPLLPMTFLVLLLKTLQHLLLHLQQIRTILNLILIPLIQYILFQCHLIIHRRSFHLLPHTHKRPSHQSILLLIKVFIQLLINIKMLILYMLSQTRITPILLIAPNRRTLKLSKHIFIHPSSPLLLKRILIIKVSHHFWSNLFSLIVHERRLV
jgi:hypothetical protein